MWDLPEAEIDTLVASRAADLYGFDMTALQTIADRIGPTMQEIKTPLPPEDRPNYPADTRCTVFMDVAAMLESTAS
jgi:hypothetical protein